MPLIHTSAELGSLVRERRRELALSQQALANAAGVSRQWIVAVERGKERAEIGRLLRLLKALDLVVHVDKPRRGVVDIDALLERSRGSG